jgi:putative MATE family efflux protein
MGLKNKYNKLTLGGVLSMQQKFSLVDLAGPIFVENFLAKAIGMLNIYLLSSYSEEAVAAMGVSNQLLNFINMLFIFVTLGTAVVMSQNLGAGNKDRAASASSIAIILNVGIGICLGLFVLLFHRPLLSMMGLSGKVMEYTTIYFTTIGVMCSLQGLNFSLGTIMRNYGRARTPMLVFLSMSILNLVGNTIIVKRPFGMLDFGIGGIATWTVFSQAIGSLVMVLCAYKYKIRLHLEKPFPLSTVREILRIGIPGAGDNFAYSIAQITLTYFVTILGTTALASFAYATNLIGFVQVLGYSVGQSSQILVGRNVGARKFDAAYHLGFYATGIAMLLNLAVMVMLMIFQRPLLHLFTTNQEIMSIVFWCFAVDLVIEFGRPFNLVIGLCVRGAGDVKWAIGASYFSILLVLIPMGYVFTRVIPLGVPGVFIALCADEWLRGQLMTWRWRTRKWENAALVKQ